MTDRYVQNGDMYVQCSCNHLTSFALLMDVSDQEVSCGPCETVEFVYSVVPRAWHCGIPSILPSMFLKNAPSAGLRACPIKFADFSLFRPHFSINRNPVKGSNLDCAHVFDN